MPTYEYEREDGTRFEIEQRISEDALKVCPTTGQSVKRLISATSFQLKGSGWYKTDYASSSSGGGSTKSEAKAEAKSESKTETKSEAKTETKSETKKATST